MSDRIMMMATDDWERHLDDARAQRIRDIVREQWRCMVAVRMVADDDVDDDGGVTPPQSATEERMASESLAPLFPSAVEIVQGGAR